MCSFCTNATVFLSASRPTMLSEGSSPSPSSVTAMPLRSDANFSAMEAKSTKRPGSLPCFSLPMIHRVHLTQHLPKAMVASLSGAVAATLQQSCKRVPFHPIYFSFQALSPYPNQPCSEFLQTHQTSLGLSRLVAMHAQMAMRVKLYKHVGFLKSNAARALINSSPRRSAHTAFLAGAGSVWW